MSGKVGTVPNTYTFSLQDVANVVGYNNLSDCEAYDSVGLFPGGNTDNNSLRHFRKFFIDYPLFLFSTGNESITICPYTEKRILILQIATAELQIRPVGTPKLNGVSFTQAGNNNGNYAVEIWYMLNPPAGTYNLYVQANSLIYCNLSMIPYTSSVSLYSTAFNSGNSVSPSVTVTTPATNALVVGNLIVDPSTAINGSIGNWIRVNWSYGNATGGYMECDVFTSSSPLTVGYTLTDSRAWKMAVAVFNIS